MHPAPPRADPLPPPADPAAAARLREGYAQLGAAERRAAARPPVRRLLDAIGGNSPYLSDLALREPRTVRAVAALGPDRVVDAILRDLDRVPASTPRAGVASALRRAKRRAALAIALADLRGTWRLREVTGALTRLADGVLRLAVAHLLRTAHDAGEIRLPDPVHPQAGSGFVVLGMGKLGARELNYSSDVDLILLYDPEAHPYHEGGLGGTFTRIARGLVQLLETRDADGYAFRTDLRLRPDPAATPPAVSLPAALTYYEGLGQTWERAAMIKARPVAGDDVLGERFLAEIRPFVWRRHLDFAAIADLHAMKRRIDRHKGFQPWGTPLTEAEDPVARLLGHDLKLGGGGIREVEFVAQTLQLVWAGRDPRLREPATVPALRLLVRTGHLARDAAAELIVAYRVLRAAEHRLQMVDDRQVHRLPATVAELDRLAPFLGCADAAGLAEALLPHLTRVHRRYAEFFEPISGTEPRPETAESLRALGYREPERALATLRGWGDGTLRALRSDRARTLLDGILPALLPALARQAEPDQALARFDAFLSRLTAGVQVLSLFSCNPSLLDRVADVLGAAPRLSDHLAQVPAALEGLLGGDDADPAPDDSLRAQLADARGLEDAIVIARRFVRGEEFRLSVATMEARLDVDRTAAARSALAEAVIGGLLPHVQAEHEARYGTVPGGELAVVALGRLGAREMMAGSDLDLMLIYDHPDEVTESEGGARPVPASQYYIRLAHAAVAALTAPGLEGPLYPVDMRLRPSGSKGPVAVSLPSFRRYHQDSAWTWERMALLRARVVAGPPAACGRVTAAIAEAVRRPQEGDQLRADARAMRARLARDLPPAGPWDVKLRPGGLMDVEFIAQVGLLAGIMGRDETPCSHMGDALRQLAGAGLLTAEDARLLVAADRIWRGVQELLRIMIGAAPRGEALPGPVASALLRALGPCAARDIDPAGLDLPALRGKLEALAGQVRERFIRLVGDPEER